MPGVAEELPSTSEVTGLIAETLTALVRDGRDGFPGGVLDPPGEAQLLLNDLLGKADTYRDGALTLLAYPVAVGRPLDLTTSKITGARTVAQNVAKLLPELHITGRKDAFQTIAKGSPNYMGRDRAAWNDLLTWASEQTDLEPIRRAFLYLAAGIADTARDLPAMPALDTPRLTFSRVAGLLDFLIERPSRGAHEQFIFAALLKAYLDQLDEPARVVTKSLNAADASARTAGDVQVMRKGEGVAEAYEVTANEWPTKIDQARETARVHDLRRVHILGREAADLTGDEIAEQLGEDEDISALEIRHEIRSLVHRLQKPGRREALKLLYEHLVERQPEDALVSDYVAELERRGLIEPQ